jgi:hypothetical protein
LRISSQETGDDGHVVVNHDNVGVLAANGVRENLETETLLGRLLQRGGINDVNTRGISRKSGGVCGCFWKPKWVSESHGFFTSPLTRLWATLE